MSPDTENILRLRDVTVRLGGRLALDGVTADLPCSALVAVLGPNGAGKSTLLRALLGWHPLERGEIRLGDRHAHHARPRLAYLPQRAELDWDFPITVREVVAQGCWPGLPWWRRVGSDARRRTAAALEELGLGPVADEQIRRLSGGQQQRMLLARALTQGADVFLLDEPYNGLDRAATDELAAMLHGWPARGRTAVVALHDLGRARREFTHALLLDTRLVAAGPVERVLTPAAADRLFAAGAAPS